MLSRRGSSAAHFLPWLATRLIGSPRPNCSVLAANVRTPTPRAKVATRVATSRLRGFLMDISQGLNNDCSHPRLARRRASGPGPAKAIETALSHRARRYPGSVAA